MKNLRTNKLTIQVIFYLIVLGQLGLCTAYLITTLEENFVKLHSNSKHIVIDNEDQTTTPALAHQISETEKVNNLLTSKILIFFNLFNQNESTIIREYISNISVLKNIHCSTSEKIANTIHRSPPQSIV